MKKVLLFILIMIVISLGVYFFYYKKDNNSKDITIDYTNLDVEINSVHKIKEFVNNISSGTIINSDEEIDSTSLGKKNITIIINNNDKEIKKDITITIVDTEAPTINGVKDITIYVNDKIDLLKDIEVIDNSKEEITPIIDGNYDLNKPGTYNLKYIATDSSNNKTEKEFKLIIKEKNKVNNNSKLYVKINKKLNVMMVYDNDELIKTFVISAGDNTPLGTFKASDRYETLSLVGNVWGHYTVRIINAIWFHSVPYYSKPTKDNPHWDNLEYEEYNKLGSLASKGCIRLSTIDAKWIYDNVKYGTPIEIYESDSLPDGVIKPTPITIDVNNSNRGWDPTDPDPDNPWNK